jgi:hypothetical protein
MAKNDDAKPDQAGKTSSSVNPDAPGKPPQTPNLIPTTRFHTRHAVPAIRNRLSQTRDATLVVQAEPINWRACSSVRY